METLTYGNRRFYDVPLETSQRHLQETKVTNEVPTQLISYIESNVIGNGKSFIGPYGKRKVIYCDYTASGRSLHFIEHFIMEQVLPLYGNTHTTTTVTSLQTTLFRHEARDIVRNAVNASEHDAVIFTGSGCTGAVHKLISALNLNEPPVVFCGPFEHHSNLLPWREIGADVVHIQENRNGQVDMEHLEHELKIRQYLKRDLIGCFAAASNVTGVLADVNKITALLHRYGALAFWDYATAAPYTKIDMNPVVASDDQAYVYKDAVFISTHKFVGGVQSPGILVAKKKLFVNPVPSGCGGGSVFYVQKDNHRYLQEVEMREEGGTPAIVESIRAGLVFQLKETIGSDNILSLEHQLFRKAMAFFKTVLNLRVLGPTDGERLPIFSFMIVHPQSAHYLHYNFVCALLNDLYGIQARGGCACAGPYAQDLLGINTDLSREIETMLLEDERLDRVHLRRYREHSQREILRPGFVRLNLPYFMSPKMVDFVLKAVQMVAEHGWKLLPQYNYNPETGEWRHRTHQIFVDRKWLGNVSYKNGAMDYVNSSVKEINTDSPPSTLQDILQDAQEIFNNCVKNKVHIGDQTVMFDKKSNELRWFLLPSEAYMCLQKPNLATSIKWKRVPFKCTVYPKDDVDCWKWTQCICECATEPSCPVHKTPPALSQASLFKKVQNPTLSNQQNSQANSCDFKEKFIQKIESNFNNVCEEVEPSSDVLYGEDLGYKSPVSPITIYMPSTNSNTDKSTTGKSITQQLSQELEQLDFSSSNKSDCADVNDLIPLPEVPDNDVEEVGEMPQTSAVLQNMKSSGPVNDCKDSCKLPPEKSADSNTPHGQIMNGSLKQTTNSSLESNSKNDEYCGTNEFLHMLSLTASDDEEKRENPQQTHMKKQKKIYTIEKCKKSPINDVDQSKVSHGNVGKSTSSIWHPPYKHILKLTCEALEEYKMISSGDRVMVCLSGGKDSLTLLHTLRQYQFVAGQRGIKFELGAVTIDPKADSYDPSPLIPYLAELGVPYFYEEQCILEAAKELPYECASICSFCSRMKRGRIYTAARREGYNVLAMGQHLDDLAESYLMSVFFNGIIRTMKASYTVAEGDLKVIRPLVYVREKDLRIFAEEKKLPVIPENCPACFEAPKERHRMKQLLASQEILHPRLFHSLKAALKPIMAINKTGCNVNTILNQLNSGATVTVKEEQHPVLDAL